MALTATVTKKEVKLEQEKLYNIVFNLILTDGTEVLNKNYTTHYRPGDNIAAKVNLITILMQTDIDNYKAEKNIFTSAGLNNAVTSIQTGLIL